MRQQWIEASVESMKLRFLETLRRDTNLAERVFENHPNEPIEQLSKTLAEGMLQSRCGDVARAVSENEMPEYPAICKEGFEKAMIQYLTEYKNK